MPHTLREQQHSRGDEHGLEWYRQALSDAQTSIRRLEKQAAERDRAIAEMQRHTHHNAARAAALEEENEQLRRERDGLQEQLEALRLESQEMSEEMAAAARFSDKEWREHCDRVEAEGQRLRGVIADVTLTALELLPAAEEAARRRLHDEEDSARHARVVSGYRGAVAAAQAATEAVQVNVGVQLHFLSHTLGCAREELRDKLLGRERVEGSDDWHDMSVPARGLWELYLALCDVGFPTDAAVAELLGEWGELTVMIFNAAGHEPDYGEDKLAIPPTAAAYDFSRRLLFRHLPNLEYLHFSHLPPLSSPAALDSLAAAPQALASLVLLHTHYTVADLLTLCERCPGLEHLHVGISHCTDWGPYASIADAQDRLDAVSEACRDFIVWAD